MIRRFLFYLFGFLDIILFARFARMEFAIAFMNSGPSWEIRILAILRVFSVMSLLLSAVGFFTLKRWAVILSYIQFPFRFLFALWSFGFISLLSRAFGKPDLYLPLIYAAMMLECVRLICTIWIQPAIRRP